MGESYRNFFISSFIESLYLQYFHHDRLLLGLVPGLILPIDPKTTQTFTGLINFSFRKFRMLVPLPIIWLYSSFLYLVFATLLYDVNGNQFSYLFPIIHKNRVNGAPTLNFNSYFSGKGAPMEKYSKTKKRRMKQ